MADLFEEKSKKWDKNTLVQQLSSGISQAIIDNIPLDNAMKVMDFGAGTGLISSHIAPHVAKITAVDISESMLSKLVEKEHLQDKAETCCQNILEIPLTQKFDLIMSAMAMHHVKDTQELVQSFASHLNSGAQVALADLDNEDGSFHGGNDEGVHHLGFDRRELHTLFEENGFKDVQFTTALTLNREGKEYPIFLLTAQKA
jgi:2-polyprenyl-3-methyl-5-hydroxy-6-metoxy-1,4-benzoquinol methylase